MPPLTPPPLDTIRCTVGILDPWTLPALAGARSPLVGLSWGDQPVHLPDEKGNVLIAAGAAHGTTTVLRSLAAQFHALGAAVTVADLGAESHPWARELPGVRHLTRGGDILDALFDLDSHSSKNPDTPDWDGRHVLVVDRADDLAAALRERQRYLPIGTRHGEAEGLRALARLLATTGRGAVQVLLGSSSATVPAADVPLRRLFATRLLAGGTGLWGRAAPETWAPPRAPTHPGRMHLVAADGSITAVQTLHLTSEQARAAAAGPC
ncbi:hypothetical protein [Kitasatospora sp. NPDC088783]|uniref:hypothetical protein n=1 Tax=Kitasatospora sp. NPDC088783 TaxID=3364077 RepID=UPI0037F97597